VRQGRASGERQGRASGERQGRHWGVYQRKYQTSPLQPLLGDASRACVVLQRCLPEGGLLAA